MWKRKYTHMHIELCLYTIEGNDHESTLEIYTVGTSIYHHDLVDLEHLSRK